MKRILIHLKYSFVIFVFLFFLPVFANKNIEVIKKSYIWKFGNPLQVSIIKVKKGAYQPIIMAAPENEVMPLSKMIKKKNGISGINAGFFGRENNEILGILAINGRIYAKKNVKWRWSILISHNGGISFKYIKPSNLTYNLARKYRAILSGGNILIKNGRVVAKKSKRNPMSGIGISKNYIYLIVVDGRRLNSLGIDEIHFARLFKEYKCYNAIALDGGGSSELIIRKGNFYKILNHPSDGAERRIKTSIIFLDKNIVKISLPKGYPDSIFQNLNKYFLDRGFLCAYVHGSKDILTIEYGNKKAVIDAMSGANYSSIFYYKIHNARFIFGRKKYLEFNMKIKKLPDVNNRISIYDGFDHFPLLVKRKDHYELTTSFSELSKNIKLSQFLIYNVFNDIIKKGEN